MEKITRLIQLSEIADVFQNKSVLSLQQSVGSLC